MLAVCFLDDLHSDGLSQPNDPLFIFSIELDDAVNLLLCESHGFQFTCQKFALTQRC